MDTQCGTCESNMTGSSQFNSHTETASGACDMALPRQKGPAGAGSAAIFCMGLLLLSANQVAGESGEGDLVVLYLAYSMSKVNSMEMLNTI